MSFAKKLVEASTREIEAGGALWRLRTITTMDLVMTGMPMLAKLPSAVEGDAPGAEAQAEAILKAQPEALVDFARMRDAIVCAAVVAGRSGEDPWEAVRLVLARDEEDLDAAPPAVFVEELPHSVRNALWLEAMALANDDGRLAKAMGRFRDGSDGAAGA